MTTSSLGSNCASGTLLATFKATADGVLFSAEGEKGKMVFRLEDDFPVLEVDIKADDQTAGLTSGRVMRLDMEDLTTVADGQEHSLAITVEPKVGTCVYIDGYYAFAGTADFFFSATGASEIWKANNAVAQVENVQILEQILSPEEIAGLAVRPNPLVQFAANRLCDYDAQRVADLANGTICARFRVRGIGQGGTILSAGSKDEEKLALRIEADGIYYQMRGLNGQLRTWFADGDWADGNWHDVAVRAAEGAIDIYVDGFREARIPGQSFFADATGVEQVVIGQDIFGTRLFGEAAKAAIYEYPLTDGQLKRLSHVKPLQTRALFDRGMLGSISYRIPSLLTLPSGVVIAGADQRTTIANDSPNDINFVIRRSLDGGETWEEPQTVIEYPGEGRDGASVIDSCSVYDAETGQVVILIDHFPGGIGQPNNEHGVGVDPNGRLILHDGDGNSFFLNADGSVDDADGQPTDYQVDGAGNVHYKKQPGGNIYLKDGVDANQTLLTARTSYLVMITSDDEGATWSEPIHLNHQVKEEWMAFLGTSPGTGLQLRHGAHKGRLVMPIYYSGKYTKHFSAAVVYSDDHGKTWHRSASPNDGREFEGEILNSQTLANDAASTHESTLLELSDGRIMVLMRNQHPSGRVGVSYSENGGETWGPVFYHQDIPEIFSQPHAIALPGQGENGTETWYCFANASQMLPFRGNGVLRISKNEGETWETKRTFHPGHYVYQALTWLPNNQIGLLWENEWQGLYFTMIPLSWFE